MKIEPIKYDYEGTAKVIEQMSKLYPLIEDKNFANSLLTQLLIPKNHIKD